MSKACWPLNVESTYDLKSNDSKWAVRHCTMIFRPTTLKGSSSTTMILFLPWDMCWTWESIYAPPSRFWFKDQLLIKSNGRSCSSRIWDKFEHELDLSSISGIVSSTIWLSAKLKFYSFQLSLSCILNENVLPLFHWLTNPISPLNCVTIF